MLSSDTLTVTLMVCGFGVLSALLLVAHAVAESELKTMYRAKQGLENTRARSAEYVRKDEAKNPSSVGTESAIIPSLSARCEGWRRHGGVFSLGPVSWRQCEEMSTVMLTVKQSGKTQTLPACQTCWAECIENGVEIAEAVPVKVIKAYEG